MPISRVRSVTDTSMMFMITMPPTTSETAAIPIVAMKNVLLNPDQMLSRLALVSISKLSSSPTRSCRWARNATRASSIAWLERSSCRRGLAPNSKAVVVRSVLLQV